MSEGLKLKPKRSNLSGVKYDTMGDPKQLYFVGCPIGVSGSAMRDAKREMEKLQKTLQSYPKIEHLEKLDEEVRNKKIEEIEELEEKVKVKQVEYLRESLKLQYMIPGKENATDQDWENVMGAYLTEDDITPIITNIMLGKSMTREQQLDMAQRGIPELSGK